MKNHEHGYAEDIWREKQNPCLSQHQDKWKWKFGKPIKKADATFASKMKITNQIISECSNADPQKIQKMLMKIMTIVIF